jgi:hypothetical protein
MYTWIRLVLISRGQGKFGYKSGMFSLDATAYFAAVLVE